MSPELQYQKVVQSALPDGASTEKKQAAIEQKIDAVIASLEAFKKVVNEQFLGINLRGTLNELNEIDAKIPPLSGGSVPVTGPLTNTQLRATAVPVSGPLTDTQLRAVAVPVSNTNLDTALSTRLKSADTLAGVTTVGTITNAVTVQQSTPANLKVDLSGTAANTTAIKVDGSGVTGPVKIVDASGNNIESTQCTNGSYHLGVSAIQSVYTDPRNSDSGHELNAGNSYTFTGLYTSTLGVAAIQVTMFSNQNATVYVDQSMDHVTWDLTDTYNYYTAVGNFGITVQAVSNYYRVRVVSVATTTGFKINSCLCPIVDVVPRSLDPDGLFQTTVGKITGRMGRVRISPMGGLRVAESTRLAGSVFIGSTIDSNYWTVAAGVGAGAASQANGIMTLTTGTPTADGAQVVNSVRTARYVASLPNFYRGVVRAPAVTTGSASYANTRRFGAYDVNDGYFFQLVQTNPATSPTLSVVCRKATADTAVASGSFNGDYGSTYTFGTNSTTVEIWWTNNTVWFFINDILLHKVTSSTTTAVATPSLKVGMETVNSGGNTAANTLELRACTISRLGQLTTQPTYKYQAGTTAVGGVVCKIGAGNVHTMVVGGIAANAAATLYDGLTVGTGTVIWASGAMVNNTNPFSIDFHGLPFYSGLILTVLTANANVLVTYE